RPVADTDDKLWELRIEYLPATDPDKFNPRTLTLTRNARMDPKVAVVADTDKDKKCLNEGYKYRPTDNCTIKFVATDPWSSDTINITVTDGKNVKDIGAYLAPRAKLKGEKLPWPSAKLADEWKKAHKPTDNPINVLTQYADQITLGKPFSLQPRSADTEWFFVEGKRQIVKDKDGHYMYSLESEYVQINKEIGGATSAVAGSGNDCVTGNRIDAAGKIINLGIGIGGGRAGQPRCKATFQPTQVGLVWDPTRTTKKKQGGSAETK